MTGAAPLILVLDLQDRRPVWAMPSWVPERIREALPPGSELRVMEVPADGSGDGTARVHPDVLAAVHDADAYLGFGIPPEVLRRGRRLRWVHSGAAGVGGSLTAELEATEVVFTNSAGVHAEPIAETVLGMILHFFRGLDFAVASASRDEGRWDTRLFYAADTPVRELSRSTVGIVGFGGVGRAVGARCAALGATVLGLRRSRPEGSGPGAARGSGPATGDPDSVATGDPGSATTPDPGTAARGDSGPDDGGDPGSATAEMNVPGGGTVEASVWAFTDGLGPVLERSDVVVLSVPETPETRGMVDTAFLAGMRPGSVLINVGRGGLVDEGALLAALEDGQLRGVALDVTSREPLPDDHPFWRFENVLVTPHVSAVTDGFWERETTLVVENVRRLVAGRPLRNVVDPERGY